MTHAFSSHLTAKGETGWSSVANRDVINDTNIDRTKINKSNISKMSNSP